jgi:hypothetical protein
MLAARHGKRFLPQGVAHQAARRVFLVGVKNRLMPRELAASVANVNFQSFLKICLISTSMKKYLNH